MKYAEFNNDFVLAYSKSFDSLPLTEFQILTEKPCLSDIAPSWPSNDFKSSHYLNEFTPYPESSHNCPKFTTSGNFFADPYRYKNIAKGIQNLEFKLTEFE